MKLNLKHSLAFFDLETTGLSITEDRIVEVAIVKVNVNNTVEEKSWLINPEISIPAESTAIHKITNAMVANKPTFKEVAHEIYDFIGDSDLAGYNVIKFDIPFLAEEFTKAGLDFNVSKKKFVDVQNIFHKMEPRNLKAAYRFYCGNEMVDAHEALVDTKSTYEVFLAQLDHYKDVPYTAPNGSVSIPIVNDIDKLSEFTSQTRNVDLAGFIIYNNNNKATFNFGKYKGKDVNEVFNTEPQYYDWMMKGKFPEYTKKVLTRLYTDYKMQTNYRLF